MRCRSGTPCAPRPRLLIPEQMQPDDQTPLMRQYWELKAQAGDALLLFRMGDFYELFGPDAVEAAKLLEITLTSRDKNKTEPMPMAGVPHHSVQGYIQRLLKAGKKVAIGEQMEDTAQLPPSNSVNSQKNSPKSGKSIVRREIVRTFTPGVQFDLEGSEANYLATLVATTAHGPTSTLWTLACLDASTGEALVSEPRPLEAALADLHSLPVRQVLRLGGMDFASQNGAFVEELPFNYLAAPQAAELLKRQYEIEGLEAFFGDESAIHALGILVTYALRTQQKEKLAHLKLPSLIHQPTHLALSPAAAQHLDLMPLFDLINRTRSAPGARRLKKWIFSPLKSPAEVRTRQSAVRELAESLPRAREKISTEMAQVYDLERIIGRVGAGLANPRDTLALGLSLRALGQSAEWIREAHSPLLTELRERLTELAAELAPLGDRIVHSQLEEAPLIARDGGIFKGGVHPDLDRWLKLTTDGESWLVQLEAREREATRIPSLKVRYNRVFGYFIEITQTHLKNVPSHYQRKQTTVGGERFFTEELKKFEDEIVHASSRQKALESALFQDLLAAIRAHTRSIVRAAEALSELDALQSLAAIATQSGWTLPTVDDTLDLQITAGRHPLVDAGAARGSFVPNDMDLSADSRALLITGPNMGGKSTVMRQTALIVILGQMGGAVPATAARWGFVSSLHTRIGAHDAIARGQSTFMVEMSELAHILHHADERSLIVLDEIGRGTSTYDGISVAWATLEWICAQIRCRTLFATHYHELTRLEGELTGLRNTHMAVEGTRGLGAKGLRFLYELRAGPAQESFGVHVARIAGLPKPVVERAWQVLEELERDSTRQDTGTEGQLSLFDLEPEPESEPEPHPVVTALEGADINQMTPIQALNFVVKLREMSQEERGAPALT